MTMVVGTEAKSLDGSGAGDLESWGKHMSESGD